jgi:large-conductance mechanosensitive channel
MVKEKDNLEKLKKDYSKIQKQYNLPDFEQLNQDFQIERGVEFQTDYLIREIRKFMADKFSNYLRFIETIINPVNVPMFVFSIVKAMTQEDKKQLIEVYKKLTKIEINLIEIDVKYSEKKEVKFIKESYKIWQEIKKDVLKFINSVQKNWDNKIKINNKGYFG